MENNNQLNQSISNKDKRILLPLLFLPCLLITRVLDNDTWFLLNSGRYVMNNGIPHIEPFTIHENMHFVMQQWLTDVIYWITYDNFGENGLFVIVMICYAIIIFLMYKLTMKLSNCNFFVSYAITILVSIYIYPYMVIRPTIFTLILIMLELLSLESYISSKNNKFLMILPFLSLLQINLHAALWPILFILFVPYIIDSFNFKICSISGQGYEKKYLFLTIIIMILVGFLNPYGIESMTYLVRSYGYPEMNIILEMQPANINNAMGIFIFLCIILITFIYIFYRKGKTKIRYFLLTIGTTYMVLTSVRNISIFALCSLFPLSYYLKDFQIPNKQNTITKRIILLRKVLVSLIVIILLISVYKKTFDESTTKEYKNLNCTIDYILNNEDISNVVLYTGFNDGSLVQYRGLSSYIDPRAEVYFIKNNNKDDIFKEYVDLLEGNLYYKKVLDKYKFTHLIVSESDILNSYLQYDNNYEIVYFNDSYKLFKKIK